MVDLLVNPMQRLTKYSLLLKVIQAKTEDEDQLKALKKMVSACLILEIIHRRWVTDLKN